MAWTLAGSGTLTPTIGAESSALGGAYSTNATYIFEVDLFNLALGETVELRVYGTTLTGGTSRQMWKAIFTGVQTNPRVQSPPIASDLASGISMTIKQLTVSTARAFPWKVLCI